MTIKTKIMKYNIIKTDNYLLLVDDSEININQYVYCNFGYIEKVMDIINEWVYHTNTLGKNPIKHYKKIIAHLPLNNSPILESVDLLPPLEDDIEKLEIEYFRELEERREVAKNFKGQVAGRHPDAFGHSEMMHMNRGYIEGYNKAKEKYKYTEEDIANAIKIAKDSMGVDNDGETCYSHLSTEQIIQSLKESKSPKWFVAEMEEVAKPMPWIHIKTLELKTTTINGKTYLVGKYYND
jgi:hypothetical protein